MPHSPGPWSVNELDTRTAIKSGKRTVAYVQLGRDDYENGRLIAAAPDLLAALKLAVRIADEARDEWDRAPPAMRAGKLLIALSGHLRGYRPDIDGIHAAIAKAEGG